MGIIPGKGLFIKGVYKYSVSMKNELKVISFIMIPLSISVCINEE